MVAELKSSASSQWLEQLLSSPQSQAATQSFSSPSSAASDSTTISREAVRLSATQNSQSRTTALSSTVNGAHEHDMKQDGRSSIGQSSEPTTANCQSTVPQDSRSNSDLFIQPLGSLVPMNVLAAYGQTMSATLASSVIPSVSRVA